MLRCDVRFPGGEQDVWTASVGTSRLGEKMARIIIVHGIGHQYDGPNSVLAQWLPPLKDGVVLATGRAVGDDEVSCAFYGDVFRPSGTKSVGLPSYDAVDVEDGFEQEFLSIMWDEVRSAEGTVSRGAATKGRAPGWVQSALDAICMSRFGAGLVERALILNLKQVAKYFTMPELRQAIQGRVRDAVSVDASVIVAHSLGSVVAYEYLCASPDSPVRILVSLGSPLGIRNLIFDRLIPPPVAGRGIFPGGLERWFNIADAGDIVALTKELAPSFGPRVTDMLVHNGGRAHNVRPYLTAKETGHAIASGL